MLRRKLDYQYPNQRAEVSIADAKGSEFKPAGVWYLAGSNTCVFSRPREELGATAHTVQTSNRRFRDDEFLVPRELTEGRSAICVQVRFTPRPSFAVPAQQRIVRRVDSISIRERLCMFRRHRRAERRTLHWSALTVFDFDRHAGVDEPGVAEASRQLRVARADRRDDRPQR